MKILWLESAYLDLIGQIDFIATQNPNAAIGQLEVIENAVDNLSHFPEIGRPRRVASTRELIIQSSPLIVVYRYKPRKKVVQIIRVLHGKQNYPK
ncbi:MAG: RelE/StbE family addiction module toxin [Hyphomonadaceae bacterium]|nr:MAG: RelE/StbE family addiction module toxin [Hyphomonadaceae bacterium]